ncbi:hypothetical protein PPYR_10204 [Photinus pyralis]|uniref:Uncharacterized protein n=1 Tax=Photinus pyralis TaxID=7054 RepID=A0A5N4AFQ3_PHOPY|nr:hypothetical protein PPYR_10204 [Photinus pyralis]
MKFRQEKRCGQYSWLSQRKARPILLTRQECEIRKMTCEMSTREKVTVLDLMIKWFNNNPFSPVEMIPEACIGILNDMQSAAILKQVSFKRTSILRQSVARLSLYIRRKRAKFTNKPEVFYIQY